VLSAATACVIERQFLRAALWCVAGAALSAIGRMHSYQWLSADTALSLRPAWPWAIGYLVMAGCFVLARWVTVPVEGPGHSQ
jgi:adenine/guanine/hypoxanthine permease